MGIALALSASLTWGLADFFGPLQGRMLGTLRALVYVQLGGLAGIAVMLAAVGFGGYFPFMHAAGNADFWWASLIFRITSTSVTLLAVAVQRPSLAVEPLRMSLLALIGFGDMMGNLLFAAASTTGLVS